MNLYNMPPDYLNDYLRTQNWKCPKRESRKVKMAFSFRHFRYPNQKDYFSIQIYPQLVGNMASETTFLVFSWGKVRKRVITV